MQANQEISTNKKSIFANKELALLAKVFVLFFLISFIYNLLRPLKVTVVATSSTSGACIIPFLKFWANLPTSVLFAFLCIKLHYYFNRLVVFNVFLFMFLGSFALFTVIYPNQELVALYKVSNFFQGFLPKSFDGFVNMILNWHLSLFYVMSELWGIIMLTVLSWGLINECISFNNAKKYYTLLAAGADSAGIFSGQFAQALHFNELQSYIPFGNTPWEQTVCLTVGFCVFLGILVGIIYRSIYYTAKDNFFKKELSTENTIPNNKYLKKKPSLYSSIKYCLNSKYLTSMAILVISYFVVFNTFEVIWTDDLRKHFNNPIAMNAYLNQLVSITGILAAIVAVFISRKVLGKFGWLAAALITPITIFVVASLYYSNFIFFHSTFKVGNMPLVLVMGSVLYCLARSTKYTVFDATKEMAFIPLPKETKSQSKVVIDALASRLGKSGSAVLMQFLIVSLGSLAACVPFVATISAFVLCAWLMAAKRLDSLLTEKNIELDLENTSKDITVKKDKKQQPKLVKQTV